LEAIPLFIPTILPYNRKLSRNTNRRLSIAQVAVEPTDKQRKADAFSVPFSEYLTSFISWNIREDGTEGVG
jgi:hypothetical protein